MRFGLYQTIAEHKREAIAEFRREALKRGLEFNERAPESKEKCWAEQAAHPNRAVYLDFDAVGKPLFKMFLNSGDNYCIGDAADACDCLLLENARNAADGIACNFIKEMEYATDGI